MLAGVPNHGIRAQGKEVKAHPDAPALTGLLASAMGASRRSRIAGEYGRQTSHSSRLCIRLNPWACTPQ